MSIDANGDYVVNGSVVRTKDVPYNDSGTTIRRDQLHEKYTKSRAQALGPSNDTSFRVFIPAAPTSPLQTRNNEQSKRRTGAGNVD